MPEEGLVCLRSWLVSTNTLGDLKVSLQPYLETVVQLKRQAVVGSVIGKVELGMGAVSNPGNPWVYAIPWTLGVCIWAAL